MHSFNTCHEIRGWFVGGAASAARKLGFGGNQFTMKSFAQD